MENKSCPMFFNNSSIRKEYEMRENRIREFECLQDGCAWWYEDAQKCSIAVIAEAQRRKGK
jgi:hypothetical protein